MAPLSATLDADFTSQTCDVLEAWSRAPKNPLVQQAIVAEIERQAVENPAAPAVTLGEKTWSYGELLAASQSVAGQFRSRGIGRGDFVGVFCRRSPELVAVVLGIWRCGAVYVPLDPKYPSERLKAILNDAAPKLIVHDDASAACIRREGSLPVDVATLFNLESASDPGNVPCAASLDDRAVVLYTSGSTGKPKGVVLTQRNLANHNRYVVRDFGIGPGDRRTAVCSINFDASLEEIFCTLTAGAELVLPDANTLDSFDRLLAFIERRRITSMFLPTSLWRELTNYLFEARREFPTSLKLLSLGGERAPRAMYERFLKVGGRRMRWINVYGPTECSVYATTYEHNPEQDAAATDDPPIGRPIDNVRLFVLDADGSLTPPGEAGELYIGGLGVGEGYWNAAERTQQRFIENPSSDVPPGRYYRTGDLVRFRDDGQLTYVGRMDDQVKLRGFRIEPAEIEAVLLRHPAVRDAAVVAHTNSSESRYLAAYVVLREGATWDELSLRLFVGERLPDYMVPQVFMQLDTLPLSPNGKVDRRALPEPYCIVPLIDEVEPKVVEPATSLEQTILDVWRQAFALDDLELQDDFFTLGGDSLKAMALTAKLEAVLRRTVSLSMLFHARTVAGLAAELTAESATPAGAIPVLLREGDRSRPLFFIHSLAGDVWIYCPLIRALKTTSAVFGIQLPGVDGRSPTSSEVAELVPDYLRQLRTIQPHGPYRLAGYSSGGMVAFEILRQLAAQGETVEFLGLLDVGVPPAVERRLNSSWISRLTGVARNAPAYLRELGAMGVVEFRKRIERRLTRIARRLVQRRRSGSAHHELNDADLLQYFAEDISFFPEERLQMIKQHFQAIFRYDPSPVTGSADLFRVARQPLSAVPTATLGWEQLLNGPTRVHNVPGTHATLMREPNVEVLAAAFDAALAVTSS